MQKLYKLLLLNLSITILFFGCTPPSAFNFFKKDELKAEALQYTKVINLLHAGQIQATANTTYLNSVDDDFDDENQNFIVGVFISNEGEKFLNNKNYTLKINKREAKYISKLSDQHKMYGHLPVFNKWAEYYLMKFDTNSSEDDLNVVFKNNDLNVSSSVEFEVE